MGQTCNQEPLDARRGYSFNGAVNGPRYVFGRYEIRPCPLPCQNRVASDRSDLSLDRRPMGGVGRSHLERGPECAEAHKTSVEPLDTKLCATAGDSSVKFFFPDSQDFVDPTFDFHLESRSATRVRQRDDLYPHEVLSAPPYDGMLVSKAVVDGHGGGAGKYTSAQRHRFMRVGVRDYFRLNETSLETMGDCGAFTYVKERRPPFTAEEVADFYGDCGFDYGLSVDHIILAYRADLDRQFPELQSAPKEWRERQELTLELADQVLNYHRKKKFRFIPVGIAQGWSPDSYSYAVTELQKLGYSYIAFGGFVPLKTQEVLACLERASKVRKPTTAFHLLGITRCENV